MKAVLLDSVYKKTENSFSKDFSNLLNHYGIETQIVYLRDLVIMPCYSCEGCTRKTPGECIVGDDTEKFLKPAAKSNIIIGITKLSFGGYSSDYKKAVDKFALLGTPYYHMHNGKLVHRKRYENITGLYNIGFAKDPSEMEINNFYYLTRHNAMNLTIDNFRGFVIEDKIEEFSLEYIVKKIKECEKNG